MFRTVLVAFLAALTLPAAAADKAHPSITAFKKFIVAVKADDEEGIKRFVVPEEMAVLDKTGIREKLFTDLAEAVTWKETTFAFKGDKNKGVIQIEPADIPFPVRREGRNWIFDVPAMMESFGRSGKDPKAMAELHVLQTSLEMYRLHAGHYPSQAQGLKALVERPTVAPVPKRWKKSLKAVPVDPWGRNYQFTIDGDKFALRSLGADGIVSDDDIVLPK